MAAMTLPDWNVISLAFYATLSGNVGATVYSGVPSGVGYPYVDITDTTGFEDSCKDAYIIRGTCGIEVVTGFKNQGSQKSMNDIASSIVSLMRATFSGYKAITGYKIIGMDLDNAYNVTNETDNFKVFRKILRFSYIIVQN